MSAKTIVLEYICPAMGTLFANLMWMAPVSSVREAVSIRHSLGVLNPIPWAMMLGNCVGWVAYSFIVKDFWPLIANAPGVVVAVWLNMQAAKLCFYEQLQIAIHQQGKHCKHEDDNDHDHDKTLLFVQVMSTHDRIVLSMVVLWSSVLSVVSFSPISTDTQRLIVGIVVNLNLVFFYGGKIMIIIMLYLTHKFCYLTLS